MIVAILLLVRSAHSVNPLYQSQVQAFSEAYISYGSPDKIALDQRKKGLNEILSAIENVYGASADFSGGGYDKKYIGNALTKAVEWSFIAPLTSFGDQFVDLSAAQRAVALDLLHLLFSPDVFFPYKSENGYCCIFNLLNIRERRVSIFEKALRFISEVVCYQGTCSKLPGGDVHHGNKYWYRELLHCVIEKKEAYYNMLIGFSPRDGNPYALEECLRKINVRDIMDDIIGFVLVCHTVDSNSGTSRRFTIYDRPIMYNMTDWMS